MVNFSRLNKNLASEKVDIIFYQAIVRDGKRMLKKLDFDTKISLGLVRAILDNTVVPDFYDTLRKNLRERGIAAGSTVQVRARFSESHEMAYPELKGTKILCEITI